MLSIGLILATLGLAVAMLAGMVWVNIGVRRGWAPALARCVAPDVKTESWEAFGVSQGCFVPFTSTFVSIWPVIAVRNLWILVGIGVAVTVGTIIFLVVGYTPILK